MANKASSNSMTSQPYNQNFSVWSHHKILNGEDLHFSDPNFLQYRITIKS